MASKHSKNIYWLVLLIIFLAVFISGCIQPRVPSATLMRPSDNSITEQVNESKLKPDYYYPDCYPTSPAGGIIGTGKRWAREFNMRLICESACPREYKVFLPWPVQETFDGGFITVGYISNLTHTSTGAPPIRWLIGGPVYEGPRHVYLLKADADGNLMNKTYGEGIGNAVQQTKDGGYIIAVYKGGAVLGEGDGSYLMKTDAGGSMKWSKSFELCGDGYDDRPYSIFQTSDEGYIVAGISTCDLGSSERSFNGFLLKVDANGNKIWGKTFGVGRFNRLLSVYQTSDGGYIAFGSTRAFSKGSITSFAPAEFYLVKTDADGNMILNRTFGDKEYSDVGYFVKQTSDGGFVVSRTNYIFKLDENGNRLWNKTFKFTHNGCPESYGYIESPFWQTSDGGFVAVAHGGAEEQNRSNIKLVKFNENGTMMWYKQVFAWGKNIISGQTFGIRQTSDGGYIIGVGGDPGGGAAGRNEHGDAYWLNTPVYYYLAKTDENGNI
ncbi:hypothetical protein HYU06_05555 [Candidatus Woesearchaeota archaeon]|nr:hypothetical protein [Candidatus Woesearchaeota archaeon]